MSTKDNPGDYDCYTKAEPDEPMFILLARDPVAATMVRIWIKLRRMLGHDVTNKDRRKIGEAKRVADAMDKWRIAQQAQGRFTDD